MTDTVAQRYPENLLEMVRSDFHFLCLGIRNMMAELPNPEVRYLFRCLLGGLIPFAFVILFLVIFYPVSTEALVAGPSMVFLLVTTVLGVLYCVKMFQYRLCISGGISLCLMMVYSVSLFYGLVNVLEWF